MLGQIPMGRAKLLVCGAAGVGKTELIDSLKCHLLRSLFRKRSASNLAQMILKRTHGMNIQQVGHTSAITQSHPHTQTSTHSNIHTLKHPHTQTSTHSNIHTLKHPHTQTSTHSNIHTLKHPHIQTSTHSRSHANR